MGDRTTDYFNEGFNFIKLERYSEAVTSYDKVIAITPNDAEAWFNRGFALEKLGMYAEALTSIDNAIAITPNLNIFWVKRGNILRKLGRHEEAVKSYDMAIAITPNFHSAWFFRGEALEDLSRHEEAVASFDKCLAIKPDEPKYRKAREIALMSVSTSSSTQSGDQLALEKLVEMSNWITHTMGAISEDLTSGEFYKAGFKAIHLKNYIDLNLPEMRQLAEGAVKSKTALLEFIGHLEDNLCYADFVVQGADKQGSGDFVGCSNAFSEASNYASKSAHHLIQMQLLLKLSF
jgi:tetratricopeptide (TPR) repeat protein